MSSQSFIYLKKNRMPILQVVSTERSHEKKMGPGNSQLTSGFPFQILLLFDFPMGIHLHLHCGLTPQTSQVWWNL